MKKQKNVACAKAEKKHCKQRSFEVFCLKFGPFPTETVMALERFANLTALHNHRWKIHGKPDTEPEHTSFNALTDIKAPVGHTLSDGLEWWSFLATAIEDAKQERREHIKLFRSTFGQLTTSTVMAFEGWTASNNSAFRAS